LIGNVRPYKHFGCFVDIARAHENERFFFYGFTVFYYFGKCVETVRLFFRLNYFSTERVRRYSVDRVFSRRKYRRKHYSVGMLEGCGEIIHQRLSAAVCVRLEHHCYRREYFFSRGDRSLNFGRMVGVVGKYGFAVGKTFMLEPSRYARKSAEPG